MNKAELVEQISKDSKLTKANIEHVINAAIEVIKQSVTSGESVTLVGFGTFTTTHRKARTAKNPVTGRVIQVPATTVPRFKPGKEFRSGLAKH